MDQTLAPSDLAALSQKLDLLTAQVRFLTEEAERASRAREARSELVNDVLPIVDDVYRMTTEQLEEIQDYVDLNDLLRLIKRLMRNGRNLEAMLDRLESLMDLAQTVGPLADSAFEKATDVLQDAEQKGYFALARNAAHLMEKVVTSSLDEPVDTSLRALIRQMRDPDVRRGLGLSLHVLALVGAQAGAGQSPVAEHPEVQPLPAKPRSAQA